jgi:hypothetical protein
MKTKFFLGLISLLLFAFAVSVYNPPGVKILNPNTIEYVIPVVDNSVMIAQVPAIENLYCIVSGGTRPGVINNMSAGLYAEVLSTDLYINTPEEKIAEYAVLKTCRLNKGFGNDIFMPPLVVYKC